MNEQPLRIETWRDNYGQIPKAWCISDLAFPGAAVFAAYSLCAEQRDDSLR
jgi:hypothetical protein